MSSADYLLQLVNHMRWADERTLDSLSRIDPPPADVLELMAHVAAAEHVWLTRLDGRLPVHPVWPVLDLEACRGLARENARELDRFVRGLDRAGLDATVTYRTSAGTAFESRVEDMLLQVVLHGMYHRGQIALLLRRGGNEPSPTDYIAYVRGAPAATRAAGPG
jgi:uncharacterized damage-inducible protein DinB